MAASNEHPDSPTESDGVQWEEATCALCGDSGNRIVVTATNLLYGRPGRVRIVCCDGCGHYYQSPRPTPATIGLCYPQDYGPHIEHRGPDTPKADEPAPRTRPWYLSGIVRAIPGLRWLYYRLEDRTSEILPPTKEPGKALEIGCGAGRYLDKLKGNGWEVEGIEPATEPSERCRERGLHVQTGTFEAFEFDAASYDAVIAWMVIEHLHDPVQALREVRRIIKSDGVLIFSVPNFSCWETWFFRRYHYMINEPTHLHHFTPRSLKQLLARSGFKVTRLLFQQNLYYVIGSLGIWISKWCPMLKVGQRMLDFCESPSMRGRLALAPFAKLSAALRQTGRITIVATPDLLFDAAEETATRKES